KRYMSCALQRACATRKIGMINSGVQTYKIKSRQLSRIQKPGFRAAAGAPGTVVENAVTCCMPRRQVFLKSRGKSMVCFALMLLLASQAEVWRRMAIVLVID